MAQGCMVALEGGEGCGKTTQGRLLAAWLRDRGIASVVVREPGSTWLGERLRALLLDPQGPGMGPVAETLLFAAARAEAVREHVAPALARGAVVVCDRFADSSVVYQGYGLGVDVGFVRRVNETVTGGRRPDLTVVLDVPRETAEARRSARGGADRIERRPKDYHERVRQAYLRLVEACPARYRLLDAARPPEAVQQALRALVRPLLEECGLWRGADAEHRVGGGAP